jgi:uncharacterized protein (DUF362 family)
MPSASRVALCRGDDRYDSVRAALALVADQIDLTGKQRVLIKPNFVVTNKPLAATHVDAVRAVLDFLRERYDGPITIAEGPAVAAASEGFRCYGYEPLVKAYGVELADLNHDAALPVIVYDWRRRPLQLHLARSIVESDFRISVTPPKTHDVVIVTLGLKNMIMGSLISYFSHAEPTPHERGLNLGRVSRTLARLVPQWVRRLPLAEWLQFRVMSNLEPSDKMRMHQSIPLLNLNLALIAPRVVPHLTVIDGFEGMEGNGPSSGTSVPLRLALASVDALAADVAGAALMGFQADDVGYLHYCKQLGLGIGELSDIEIVGNALLEDCARSFRPHDTFQRQRRWPMPDAGKYLHPARLGAP